ncbi:MAG: ferritin family protein [Nitrospinae bacterium]|nr:ferritin family protein [Nitrospinota bacterium]
MVAIEKGEMTAVEVINTAIYNEKLAAEHYEILCDMCLRAGNPSVSDFFHHQANRERGHYNRLIKLKRKRGKDNSPAVGEYIRWVLSESGAGAKFLPSLNMDEALKMVESRENDACRFYSEAARKTTDPELAGIFAALAEEESHHQYLARKLRTDFEQKGIIDEMDYVDLGFE